MHSRFSLSFAALAALSYALPEPTANPEPVARAAPAPEPSVTDPTRTFKGRRRNILSDATADLGSALNGLPSYVASGVPQLFVTLPSGSAAASSAGVSNVDAVPTSVANYPPYANWTGQNWNVRFHGNVYRQPNISESKLNDLTNDFLIGTSVQDLPPDQAAQARNVTAEIFVVQDANAPAPVFSLTPIPPVTGGAQTVNHSFDVTVEGDFDEFVPIESNGLDAGDQTNSIQILDVHTQGSDVGNATAYLVPPTGLTILSDIDDILRITKIWEPSQIILNTFAKPYVPWMNMPEIYANWSANLKLGDQATHFHYLTTLPEQVTRQYESYIYGTYPLGSFDTRPLNFSDVSATLSIRKFLLERVFMTFPQRKFVLVADTSNGDVMKDYPAMYTEHPDQVQCILLRNTSATDDSLKFPYDTSGFKDVPADKYMFFYVPDDLKNLDIAGGQCVNASRAQNVTFGEQGLPGGTNLGSGKGSGKGAASTSRGYLSGWVVVSLAALLAAWNLL